MLSNAIDSVLELIVLRTNQSVEQLIRRSQFCSKLHICIDIPCQGQGSRVWPAPNAFWEVWSGHVALCAVPHRGASTVRAAQQKQKEQTLTKETGRRNMHFAPCWECMPWWGLDAPLIFLDSQDTKRKPASGNNADSGLKRI